MIWLLVAILLAEVFQDEYYDWYVIRDVNVYFFSRELRYRAGSGAIPFPSACEYSRVDGRSRARPTGSLVESLALSPVVRYRTGSLDASA